jgi:hypothetical protein
MELRVKPRVGVKGELVVNRREGRKALLDVTVVGESERLIEKPNVVEKFFVREVIAVRDIRRDMVRSLVPVQFRVRVISTVGLKRLDRENVGVLAKTRERVILRVLEKFRVRTKR